MTKSCLTVMLCAGLIGAAAAAGQPAGMDAATVGRCRSATALVRPDGGGRGTAFCIHGAGLFLASHHVVGDAEAVALVMNSGTDAEKPVLGRVLRRDRPLDVVLILAEDRKGGYTALQLGGAADLVEQSEIATFGFPESPGPPTPKNPPINTDTGRITALQTEEGRTVRVETDAALHPGNSGGAMVNRQGLVVGAVAAGAPGKPLSYCLPANRIRDFLSEPVIVFEPLPILESESGKPVEFECRVFRPGAAEPGKVTVQLTLQAESGAAIVVEFKDVGTGVYRATTALPALGKGPLGDGPAPLLNYRLLVTHEGKTVGSHGGTIPLVSFERGLLSHLKFSEETGNQAADSSGQENHGALSGDPKWLRDVSDGVIEMDGLADAIDIPLVPAGSAEQGRSMAIRLRSTPGAPKGTWLESGVPRTLDDFLKQGIIPGWPEAWGNVTIKMLSPAQRDRLKPIDDGDWHELVLVCDAEAGRAALYVDGELVAEGTPEPVPGRPPTIQVGRTRTGPEAWAQFRGQLDAVRLYDRALSQGEVRLLGQKRDVKFGKDEPQGNKL
jgi:S1-C subfamily serine protease